jgi:hypothetical protein
VLARFTRKQLIVIGASALALIVAIVAVIVATVVIFGGVQRANAVSDYRSAAAAYEQAQTSLDTATAEYSELVSSKDTKGLDVAPLKDAIAAASALEPATPVADPESLDDAALAAATTTMTNAAAQAVAATSVLETAGETVKAAAETRLRATSLDKLKTSIKAASAILTKSKGRVDDTSLRTDLQTQITAAKAVAADDAADRAALDAARTALNEQAALLDDKIKPAFSDVDGKWCLWNSAKTCMTIDLPHANQGYGSLVITQPHSGNAATCYIGGIGDPNEEVGGAAFIYCPAGASPGSGFEAEFDNPKFDRIFITQYNGGAPYFRASERTAATK